MKKIFTFGLIIALSLILSNLSLENSNQVSLDFDEDTMPEYVAISAFDNIYLDFDEDTMPEYVAINAFDNIYLDFDEDTMPDYVAI